MIKHIEGEVRAALDTIPPSGRARRRTLAAVLPLATICLSCASPQARPPNTSSASAGTPDEIATALAPRVPPPRPESQSKVSLAQMLAYADRNAPRLQVAQRRILLGDAAVAGAKPLLPDNPEVSVGAGPRFTSDGTYTDLTASVSQRLEIAGERGLRVEAAQRARERLRAEFHQERWEVHRQVHASYCRVLVARERLGAADQILEFQTRLLEVARARFKAGEVTPLAVRVAEGELSQAQVARIAATQAYLRAQLELAAAAGWPSSHPPEPSGALQEPRDPPSVKALLATAMRSQPRLLVLQAAQREARARARLADREVWPEPTLGVEATREGGPSGLKETIVLGTLSLPIPIVQRNQWQRAEARANLLITEAEQADVAFRVSALVQQNQSAVIAAAARVRTYVRDVLPAFEDNLRLIRRAFELGEIDILQVSVARERFLRMQTDALDAYADYYQAVAELEVAIGADVWTHSAGPEEP